MSCVSTARRRLAVCGLGLVLFAGAAAAKPAAPGTDASCRGTDQLVALRESNADAARRVDAAAAATVNGEALLWRITKPGTQSSYLFGTVHLSDERVTTLSPAVKAALSGASRLALEVADMSPAAFGRSIATLRDKVVYQDGHSLLTLLTPAELAQAEAATRRSGMPVELLKIARPWLVTTLLAVSDCERTRLRSGGLPLDLRLGEIARGQGIPVLGLETIADQLSAMAAVPDDDQLANLRASLKLARQSNDFVETILRRYLAREIAMVWPMQLEIWRAAGFDPASFSSFRRELVTVRNARMRDAALPLLAEGNVFIAVGAMHLVGDDGLVAHLRRAGHRVTPVE